MKRKPLIMFMYGVALAITLTRWYKQPNNAGLPKPSVIAAPTYLYGILALTSDFTEGLGTVLAVALTVGLWWAIHPQSESPESQAQTSTTTTPTTTMAGTPTPQTRKVL